jgi:carboxyl-terminal processing protease
MDAKIYFPLNAILVAGLMLSACASLNETAQPISGDFGPQISTEEHQTATFEALWERLEKYYISFDTADVDWDSVHEEYLERINTGLSNEEFTALLNELETELPEGTLTYQSRAERIAAEIEDTTTYEGIGAFLDFHAEPEPHIVLLAISDGSPAELAGLKAHDSIFEINGDPIQLEEGLNAAERIRGPAGSAVFLNVQSPGGSQRTIEVIRGKLAGIGKLESRMVDGTNYGYILMPPIGYETMVEDVLKSLQTFTSNQKLEGLILDLRVAGSASGWPLEEMLTIFYDGNVGEFYNRSQSQAVSVDGQDVFSSQSVPLLVLIGQNTKGFPEILAASLQSNNRATLMGESTPGEVETSTSFYLPDGSIVFIQSTSFRSLNGEEIGESGVQPDVLNDAGWDEFLPDQDPVLDAAVEYLGAAK